MDFIPIKVECYSGYKVDESPIRFYWDDIQFEISEILDRWYQGGTNPEFPSANYYKVQTASSGQFILKHEIKRDTWYLVS